MAISKFYGEIGGKNGMCSELHVETVNCGRILKHLLLLCFAGLRLLMICRKLLKFS